MEGKGSGLDVEKGMGKESRHYEEKEEDRGERREKK